ncbi:V-set and immunoglobulin domain-containing protein 10-like [Salarias fasciatus]|uniref:Ig-like domain-containing protein n=1 Tax=Salarias fasciatus TaxID=181472 RepID=A0A672FDH4_SALFA|nr:V-set and immunoglobulin domain-containing protein 10-like [Salarias fasciatus]
MACPEEFSRARAVFLTLLFGSALQGAHCQLVVSPVGPSLLSVLAGSNVTLAVSFSGAPDPVVTWFSGSLPVATWTVNSSEVPDIDINRRDVLRVERNGSLTFVNVPLSYDSNYTVEMTKSGLEKAATSFSLRIFETFQNVTLTTESDFAKEGSDVFKLRYSLQRGVVQHQVWLFNGGEIESGSRYLMEQANLSILRPDRTDTGEYAVLLTNPFSSAMARTNVTVRYGPDEPVLTTHPPQDFYVSGESVTLTCRSEGFPQPTSAWAFGGKILNDSHQGVLNLVNVSTTQGGVYVCMVFNENSKERREKSLTLNIYERPLRDSTCSVESLNDTKLLFHCAWMGGTPQAELSFPAIDPNNNGLGNFSVTLEASDSLNGRIIQCIAEHILEKQSCNITARSPSKFVPAVRTDVSNEGKIVVSIQCLSEASPQAVVSWSRGSQAVTNGATHGISRDTTLLTIRHNNVSSFLLQNYTCTCSNPLGSRRREIQLQGPSISDSGLFPNQDGTIITLTWEVPRTSVVTGFDIQMKGPDLQSNTSNAINTKARSDQYRTIQQKAGFERKTDVYVLDPKSTYRFRIIPKARLTPGEPSEVHRIGPGDGLSGPAIAGIAAGIPCSLLFLLLLCCLVYFCVSYCRNKNNQTPYPVSRAVEKAKTAQTDKSPHILLAGGLKSPPDYNRLHLAPSERSADLPMFVPPPPVRVATTV